MDFGEIDKALIPTVDFSLPADPPITRSVLSGAAVSDLKVYVGCAKWGRSDWVGMIYPEKTSEAKFFKEYVKHFNSIELNATFYRMPKPEQVRKWKADAELSNKTFLFCPKFTQSISHFRRLKNAEEPTERFLAAIHEFGDRLGPSYLQMNEQYAPKNLESLLAYLNYLPKDLNMFLELRHPEWFTDQHAFNTVLDTLHELGHGILITDATGRRDCVHMNLTVPHAFIRFVGNGLHPTDFERVDAWINRLEQWISNGLQSIYFFLHQHDEKDTPILADYTIAKMNERLKLNLSRPNFISKT